MKIVCLVAFVNGKHYLNFEAYFYKNEQLIEINYYIIMLAKLRTYYLKKYLFIPMHIINVL